MVLRCTDCLTTGSIGDLRWQCPPACRNQKADGHAVPITGGVHVRCPHCRHRHLTEAFLPACGHIQHLPLEETGAGRHRHIVFLAVDPGMGQWHLADRRAVMMHVTVLLKREFKLGDLDSWVLWRRALPRQGWMGLPKDQPLRLTGNNSSGHNQHYFVHFWRMGDNPPGDNTLPMRLPMADAVILLIPAASLLRAGLPSATDRLLKLAQAMPATTAPKGTLFLCVTEAEHMLSLLGRPAAGLEGVLANSSARSAWLERCAGLHLLKPLRDHFAKSPASMVANGEFANLTDLNAWLQWAADQEQMP